MGAFVLYKEMKVLFERLAWEIENRRLEVYGIEVFEKGKIVYRRQFAPDVRYPIYSATKSFTSTAVGLAVQEGQPRRTTAGEISARAAGRGEMCS